MDITTQNLERYDTIFIRGEHIFPDFVAKPIHKFKNPGKMFHSISGNSDIT